MRWALFLVLAGGLCSDAHAAKRRKAPPPPPPPRAASAPTPPEGAHQVACALNGLPEAEVAWIPLGYLWLKEGGDVVLALDLGRTIASTGNYASCEGTTIHLTVITGGTALNVEKIDIDATDIVRREAPWRTPDAKARRRSESALRGGDLKGAREALSGLNRADPDTVDAWVEIALAAVKAGDLAGAGDDLSGLPLQQEGVTEALVAVARAVVPAVSAALDRGDISEAQRLFAPVQTAIDAEISSSRWPERARREAAVAGGRLQLARGDSKGAASTLEAVVAGDPRMAGAWLALADARWAAKDRKGARVAYAQAAGEIASSAWPPTLAERCPKCAKVAP